METVVNFQLLQTYYNNKKVFVTGHTGFKGAWLTSWLQLLGANVKGYALNPEYSECLFNIMKTHSKTVSCIADIRNKKKLEEELVSFEPDFIFHLAAQPLVRRSYFLPAETFEINAIGTANLLEGVIKIKNKCTVVIVTTDKVYENKEQDILYNETNVLGGYDPYSASKACTEMVACSFRRSFFDTGKYKDHQKTITTVRAGNVIGGGDYSEDRIIPDIIRSLRNNHSIKVRNPSSIRPWQHVLEPLGGYLLLGGFLNSKPLEYSGAYNFGPEPQDHLQVKEIVEMAINKWGSGSWDDMSNNSEVHEAGILKLDIGKAKNKLNWQPKLNSLQAIDWTIDWYKKIIHDSSENFTLQQINQYMAL